LRRLYRRAAASCRCAAAEPTSHHLHECRQRTQRLRYALEFATPWLSDRQHRLWHRTKILGTRLGRHRDLGRLGRSIDQLPIQPSHRRSLHVEIEKRRAAAMRGFLASIGKTYRKKNRRFNGLKNAAKTEKRASE
jgi:CHAD domain-containing protein